MDNGLISLGLDAAMRGAGITGVKQVAIYGASANLPDIQSGTLFAMVPDPYQEMGWMVVDSLARQFTGGKVQDTVDLTAPAITWTKDNVPPAQGNQLAPSQPGFQSEFTKAWGL
jgi:ribose transport system substrate-binding protein